MPSAPDDVLQRLLDLDRVLTEDVDAGREALRRLLQNGEIRLAPGADGVYTARGELLPLMIILGDADLETQTLEARREVRRVAIVRKRDDAQ